MLITVITVANWWIFSRLTEKLSILSGIVAQAAKNTEPHRICNYLQKLQVHSINSIIITK